MAVVELAIFDVVSSPAQHRHEAPAAGVDRQDAIWFATAHSISYLDREGRERNEPARIAGPCLVWERAVDGRRVTLRLEGNQSLADAVAAAESVE